MLQRKMTQSRCVKHIQNRIKSKQKKIKKNEMGVGTDAK